MSKPTPMEDQVTQIIDTMRQLGEVLVERSTKLAQAQRDESIRQHWRERILSATLANLQKHLNPSQSASVNAISSTKAFLDYPVGEVSYDGLVSLQAGIGSVLMEMLRLKSLEDQSHPSPEPRAACQSNVL